MAVGYYLDQLLFASVAILSVAFVRGRIRLLVEIRHVFRSTRSQLEGKSSSGFDKKNHYSSCLI